MPRLTRIQTLTRDRILDASHSALLPSEFARRVVEAVALVLPADDMRFFGLDSASRLINRLLFATKTDSPHRAMWLRTIYLAESGLVPYFAPQVLLDHDTAVVTYQPNQPDCFGLPEPVRSTIAPRVHRNFFYETETPRGGTLRLTLKHGRQSVGMLDSMRRTASHPFTATECAFLASLARPIAHGLARAYAYERGMHSAVSVSPDTGIVIVNSRNLPTYQSGPGSIWMEQIAQSDHEPSGALPAAAWAAIARFRQAELALEKRVRVQTHAGAVTIEASAGQEPGEIVLVIAPVRSRTPIEVPDSWPLTRTELEIVRLVIEGHNNRSIAVHAHVTQSTVETHLAHIYEKLGIRSRGELLSRLFSEQFLPAMQDQPVSPTSH